MNSLRAYYFFVFAMYAVIVPHYQLFLAASGYSPKEVGLLIGFFEICGVAGPMFFGRIADKTGRFRELKIGSTLGAGVFFALLLAEWSLLPAVLISGAAGFLLKTSVPLTDAVAGTVLVSPQEQYGYVRVFGSIGFAVAGLAIPLLSLVDTASASSMVIAFLTAIALFSATVLLVPPPQPDPSEQPDPPMLHQAGNQDHTSPAGGGAQPAEATSPVPDGPAIPASLWLVILLIGIGNVAFGAYNSFFSLYLREVLGIQAVTLFWAIAAVSEIPVIFFSGRLIQRFGTGTLLSVAGATMAVRLLLYAIHPSVPLVVIVQTLHAFSFGLMLSAGIAYVNRVAPRSRRGTAVTVFNALGLGLAVFTGAIIGGYVVEAMGFAAMFALIAVFPATSAVLFLFLRRSDRHLRA
ncbi:MAG: MFS transporter [Spirochaeta sp.]|nr:MFS transporter [Spirochaeta sp.]